MERLCRVPGRLLPTAPEQSITIWPVGVIDVSGADQIHRDGWKLGGGRVREQKPARPQQSRHVREGERLLEHTVVHEHIRGDHEVEAFVDGQRLEYPEIEPQLERFAGYAGSAYQHVSSELKHDLAFKVPLILFQTSSEFFQQNVIPGAAQEGVGPSPSRTGTAS